MWPADLGSSGHDGMGWIDCAQRLEAAGHRRRRTRLRRGGRDECSDDVWPDARHIDGKHDEVEMRIPLHRGHNPAERPRARSFVMDYFRHLAVVSWQERRGRHRAVAAEGDEDAVRAGPAKQRDLPLDKRAWIPRSGGKERLVHSHAG